MVELSVQVTGAALAFAVRGIAVVGQPTVRPVAGATADERVAEPAKLKVLVTVTDIEAPVAPLLKVNSVGAAIVRPPT